jgi:hypothetical protein
MSVSVCKWNLLMFIGTRDAGKGETTFYGKGFSRTSCVLEVILKSGVFMLCRLITREMLDRFWSNFVVEVSYQLRLFCANYMTAFEIRMIRSRRTRWAGHVACVGEVNAYTVIVLKPERTRPVGRHTGIWEGNIKTDLRGVGLEAVDWIQQGQDRSLWRAVVNTVMNLPVPLKVGNFWTTWAFC